MQIRKMIIRLNSLKTLKAKIIKKIKIFQKLKLNISETLLRKINQKIPLKCM